MTPARNVTLEAWHNGQFGEAFNLTGEDGPLNLTGKTGKLHIRQYGAQPGDPLLALSNTNLGGQGVRVAYVAPDVVEVRIGEFSLTLLYTNNSGGLEAGAPLRLKYDLILTTAGVDEVWMTGDFILNPGVTL